MCKDNLLCLKFVLGLIALLTISGCVTMGASMLIGGQYVEGYVPDKVLVAYKAQGIFPEGSKFYLIETGSGLAFYQQDIDGTGIICEKIWYEGDSVYFSAAFFGYGPAIIYRVPIDRTLNAERYVYENGTYQGTPGDRLRPMPYSPKKTPDAILIPSKIYDMGLSSMEISHEMRGSGDALGSHDDIRSAKIQELEYQLTSNDSSIKRNTAIKLYRSGDFQHTEILNIVSKELIEGYNQNLSDGAHIDAMAWLCKILGASNNETYKTTLEEVIANSQNSKIRSYAEKGLKTLNNTP